MKKLFLLPMMLLSIMIKAQNSMVTIDNITYSIHEADNAVVLYGRQCTGDVIIQSTVSYVINDWHYYATVRSIDENAFLFSTLTSVTIPSTVTSIGNGAFNGCSNLTSVIVKNATPVSVSSSTFSNRENATLLVPGESKDVYANTDVWKEFKTIKGYIKFADELVKSICINNWDTDGDGELSEDEAAAVTSINKVFRKSKIHTFDELKYFTGLTSIYSEAFEDCSSLTTITIPNNVKSLDKQAFSRCSSLINIGFTSSLESIGTEAFWNCTALTTFAVPNGVKTIASTAFSGCTNLTSITIPASVNTIGGTPFSGCSSLTSIIVDSNNETYESPAGSNAIIQKATNTLVAGCKSTIIPENVTTIGNNAFLNCSLTSLVIPDNVTSIGFSAFSGSNISSVTLSGGLISIGEKSFYNCNRLSRIVLPNSLTNIGVSAFQDCTNLPSIIIPNNVIAIGGLAFYDCTNLSSIVIPDNVTSIGGSVFYGCTSLKSATIGGGTIGYQQFYGCNKLESVVLNGVTAINNNAFIGCTSLTSITIPRSVTSIGSAAFNNCSNLLLVVTENENPSQINDNAFHGINSNARLQVPVGTKSKYEAITGWKNYFKEIVDDGNTPEVYTLTIKVEGLGTVNYDGTTIRNNSYSSYILGGQSTELSFDADNVNGLESIKVNNRDVTSSVNNNLYSTEAITSNTVIEVKFEFPELSDGQTFEEDYSFATFRFIVISESDKTCELALAWCDEDDVDVIVPSSVNGYQVIGIGAGAFEEENDMESITIPPTITYIGNGAFDDGGTVCDVYISDLEAWCKISFANSYSAPSYSNIWLNGKKIIDLEIPNSINRINNYAFYGLSCIQSVYIPKGIESIGNSAFPSSLLSVTVCATEPISVEESSFSNRANASLYVPYGSKDAYMAADFWKEFKEIVEMEPASLEVTDISQIDNAIYIEPFSALVGGNVNIEICLKNAEAATAYVFDLVLPDGVTVATNSSGKYIDALSDRHDDHTRTFNYKGDNTYSLSTLSGNSEELTGNDGAIRHLTLHVADDVTEGVYAIEIKNASYSKPDGTLVTLPNTTTSVTVEDYVQGDVNGNGGVDIGDAVSIVNYLVGKESSTFVEKAADTNKNGQVDIGDAVTIVNFLVGKTESLSRQATAWDEKEPQ